MMAKAIKFEGSNRVLGPPRGVTEEQCQSLHTFSNGVCSVSCWEFSDKEIEDIIRTRRAFVSLWSGYSQPPVFIGTESAVHKVVADFGKVWRLSNGN
jgi:hypothetical protein